MVRCLSLSIDLGERSSHHFLLAADEQFKIKFRSKSFDQLPSVRQDQSNDNDDNHISNTTRTEMDLTGIGCDMISDSIDDHPSTNTIDDRNPMRSQSAPVSPTEIVDKEFAAFLQCEQQQHEQVFADSFVYNMDLSNSNENNTRPTHSRREIFFVSSLIEISFPDSLVKTNHRANERERKRFSSDAEQCLFIKQILFFFLFSRFVE